MTYKNKMLAAVMLSEKNAFPPSFVRYCQARLLDDRALHERYNNTLKWLVLAFCGRHPILPPNDRNPHIINAQRQAAWVVMSCFCTQPLASPTLGRYGSFISTLARNYALVTHLCRYGYATSMAVSQAKHYDPFYNGIGGRVGYARDIYQETAQRWAARCLEYIRVTDGDDRREILQQDIRLIVSA